LGSARTALFNWLYARHTGGKFILRIEDTDLVRSDAKFLAEILADLKWMGLEWDAEPIFQTHRFEVYRKEAEKLLNEGKAYREGEAIIFRVEKGKTIELDDLIHGKIIFNTDEIKDQVMIKSDGSPAYNFSCVVDDMFQGITHIIRGDDHVSNTPKQVLFYHAFGKTLPSFCHIPLVMGADGAKLSKRHGAVAVEEYKKEGILPEALANYLILLGWSPGGDREIISLEEAAKIFDLKDMNGVQVRFDTEKLKWMNSEYIKTYDINKLLPLIKEHLIFAGLDPEKLTEDRLKMLIDIYRVRIRTLNEFPKLTECFFTDSYSIEEDGMKKYLSSADNKANIKEFAEKLAGESDFSKENIEKICREISAARNLKAAQIIHPTRMAISGKTKGAGLFEMMELLGKDLVIKRLLKSAE